MSATVRVQVNTSNLNPLYVAAVTRVGNQIVNGGKRRANVDTGMMRSRIEFVLDVGTTPPTGRVIARTNYSYWVHNGNRRTGYPGNPFLVLAARDVLG